MQDVYLPNSDTWVYEESGVVIGFISMASNEIGGLFVLPKYHSKGVGTLLVKHVSKFHDRLEVEVFSENKIGKLFACNHWTHSAYKHIFKFFLSFI